MHFLCSFFDMCVSYVHLTGLTNALYETQLKKTQSDDSAVVDALQINKQQNRTQWERMKTKFNKKRMKQRKTRIGSVAPHSRSLVLSFIRKNCRASKIVSQANGLEFNDASVVLFVRLFICRTRLIRHCWLSSLMTSCSNLNFFLRNSIGEESWDEQNSV